MRERCAIVLAAAERGETRHFRLRPERLDEAVRRVVDVTRRRYPDLAVPLSQPLAAFLGRRGRSRRARRARRRSRPKPRGRGSIWRSSRFCSMPAPGRGWRYREAETGQVLSRSEGLAVASLRAMQAGLFSADPAASMACRCRGAGARSRRSGSPRAFQHGPGNRARRHRRTSRAAAPAGRGVRRLPELVRRRRPGSAISTITGRHAASELTAAEMLRTLLQAFGPIWPGRISRSTASRSAIAAGIPPFPATGSCRFTSSANGSPIR